MAKPAPNQSNSAPVAISMYEYYTMAIHSLLSRSPWELERPISQYHRTFLAEQRCLALSIMLLVSEDRVPDSALTMALPKVRDQTRTSMNRAVFLRALEHQFRSSPHAHAFAQATYEKMNSYIQASRFADAQHADPLEAMAETLMRRIPPRSKEEHDQIVDRVGKILSYVEGIATFVSKKYRITRI